MKLNHHSGQAVLWGSQVIVHICGLGMVKGSFENPEEWMLLGSWDSLPEIEMVPFRLWRGTTEKTKIQDHSSGILWLTWIL